MATTSNPVVSTLGQIPDDAAWHRTIILPPDVLDNPPSGENDMDWDAESAHRIWGCELLQEAGILLRYAMSLYTAVESQLHYFLIPTFLVRGYDYRKMYYRYTLNEYEY